MSTELEITKQTATIQRKGGAKIIVTFQDVKKRICPKATDSEIVMFLARCQNEQLDPFRNEIYLVKYGEDPAQTIIAIESYLKVAEDRENYEGHEAGIIIKKKDQAAEFRPGEILFPEERDTLAGGYARVYLKDRPNRPVYVSVNLQEYQKFTKDGKLTHFWKTAPAAQIRKVALAHALKEAFPSRFAGTITEGEYETMEEDIIPEAFRKGEEENWKLFWAKQKEKGLNYEASLAILGIKKMHEDWLDQGKTLEQADKALTDYLNKSTAPDIKPATTQKAETSTPGEAKVIADNAGAAPSTATVETGSMPVTSASSTVEKPTQPEIQAAFDKLKSETKPQIDTEWVKMTVHELRVKGCKEVSTAALYTRFRDYYHIMDSELDGKTYAECAGLLLGAQVKDFCDWLQELTDKTPGTK